MQGFPTTAAFVNMSPGVERGRVVFVSQRMLRSPTVCGKPFYLYGVSGHSRLTTTRMATT